MSFGQSSWPILVAREEEGGSRPLSSSSVTSLPPSLSLSSFLPPPPSLASLTFPIFLSSFEKQRLF